ncbi:MAG: lysylphosphatidylglycerol synthase domain-containing protein [Bacteroidales bacterium]|jgi:hypothetical protein|nr:hypothetical protein [Bacteroidales bacterium]
MIQKTKLLKYLNIAINAIIFVATYYYIVSVFVDKSISISDFSFEDVFNVKSIFFLSFLLLLMIINWGIEALKWKIVSKPIANFTYLESIKSVLLGIFTGLFLPNRTGEFIGRVFSNENVNRKELFVHNIIANISQVLVTLIFGLISIIFLGNFAQYVFSYMGINAVLISIISSILIFALLLVYFLLPQLSKTKFFRNKLRNWLSKLKNLPIKTLVTILSLSVLRFLIFSIQYILAFRWLNIPISSLDLIALCSIYFLILAVIPSVVFTEIGIRGSVMLILFMAWFQYSSTQINNPEINILFATLAIWIINIIIPAIVGSLFMSKLKILKQ